MYRKLVELTMKSNRSTMQCSCSTCIISSSLWFYENWNL